MAKSHVATIKDCEILTDEIVKSARTFISNAFKWDSGAYRPVSDVLHKRLLDEIYKAEYEIEYGNEIAHREASRLANEFIDGLECESIDYLYNILKGYRH